MRLYFLALATLVAVCVGCVGGSVNRTAYRGMMPQEGPLPQTMNSAPRSPQYFAPPAEMLMRPGPMVDGPGPGVLAQLGAPPAQAFATEKTQIRFVGPEGMEIGWQIAGGYAENQLTTPG